MQMQLGKKTIRFSETPFGGCICLKTTPFNSICDMITKLTTVIAKITALKYACGVTQKNAQPSYILPVAAKYSEVKPNEGRSPQCFRLMQIQ